MEVGTLDHILNTITISISRFNICARQGACLLGFAALLSNGDVLAGEEIVSDVRPDWLVECLRSVEDCIVYMVNPFSVSVEENLSDENLKIRSWSQLSGRTYAKAGQFRLPPVGRLEVPMIDIAFVSHAGHYPQMRIYGSVDLGAKSVAPRKAFRRVAGCWPFSAMSIVDLVGDEVMNVAMSPQGELIKLLETPECERQKFDLFDGRKSSSCVRGRGHFYVYGESLFQLRWEVNGPLTDDDVGDYERFFVISDVGGVEILEPVTSFNYTDATQRRVFSKGSCQNIESEVPEWTAWDARSKEKLFYPPFPEKLRADYRRF